VPKDEPQRTMDREPTEEMESRKTESKRKGLARQSDNAVKKVKKSPIYFING